MIGVINYRTGNSSSVGRALEYLGLPWRLVARPEDMEGVERLILPGVGAADVTMSSLREAGWVEFLDRAVVSQGMPFLGVCVGAQVLFDHSDEQNTHCLGWLPGEVIPFDSSAVRVPQMGWNRVSFDGSHAFTAGVPDEHYYFVNSFRISATDPTHVVGRTNYGGVFPSVVARKNVMGTQFHIEKSGPAGLALLRKFAQMPAGTAC